MGRLENIVEKHLDSEIKKRGGITRKYVSPGHKGVADRLCFLPGGKLYIVEVKSKKGEEQSYQKRERHRMINLGFNSVCIFGIEGVDCWLSNLDIQLSSNEAPGEDSVTIPKLFKC